MSSITTAVVADYRLQQWAQLVKECQNRPSDMTEEQWCDTRGISKSNYYYRLHRIRKACLEHIPEDSLPCQQVVEISENIMQLPESTPDISIEIVRYGLIRLESFLEDGDYMKMDSLQQNL